MSDDPNLVSKDLKVSLPQIQVTHPKTGKVLMIATPKPGSLFDLKLVKGITAAELVLCVADLVEFHYKHCMGVQKRLQDMGFHQAQIGDLFFPNVPTNKEVQAEAEKLAAAKDCEHPQLKEVKEDG